MRNNLTMDFENQDMTNYQNTMGYLTLLLHQANQTMFIHKKGKVSSHFGTTSSLGFIFYLGKPHSYHGPSPVMCTQQLPVLHWMNNLLIQKSTLQRSAMSLLFKNFSFLEVFMNRVTRILATFGPKLVKCSD